MGVMIFFFLILLSLGFRSRHSYQNFTSEQETKILDLQTDYQEVRVQLGSVQLLNRARPFATP